MDVLGSVRHPAAQTESVQTPVRDLHDALFFLFFFTKTVASVQI